MHVSGERSSLDVQLSSVLVRVGVPESCCMSVPKEMPSRSMVHGLG